MLSESPMTQAVTALPRAVTVAFRLWWPVVLMQAILVAILLYAISQAAIVGGPAMIIAFIAGPIILGLLALVIGEAVSMFKLRRGSTVARAWLVVFAIVNVLLAWRQVAAYIDGNLILFGAASDPWVLPGTVALVVVTILCVVAAAVPFLAPLRPFFAHSTPDAGASTPA
jgi:hypothetical protein